MNKAYPTWKMGLLLLGMVVSFIYALPNWYGDDPALQSVDALDEVTTQEVVRALTSQGVVVKRVDHNAHHALFRFFGTDDQMKAKPVMEEVLGDGNGVALHLAPAVPHWLSVLGAVPMKLGLDLRGGVHFLLDVDVAQSVKQRTAFTHNELKATFRRAKLRPQSSQVMEEGLRFRFEDAQALERAWQLIKDHDREFEWHREGSWLVGQMSRLSANEIKRYTLEQTVGTLRNRVNELGVAEANVYRQGVKHIVVELPGVQDTARAKDLIGKTATLSFHMKYEHGDLHRALEGHIPPGAVLQHTTSGQAVLLNKQVILTGDAVTAAQASTDSQDGRPVVSIRLGGDVQTFKRVTRENVGKQMAVIYKETQSHQETNDAGEPVIKTLSEERIISLATIQSPLGNQFQISGLGYDEARDLALLLRSGALPVDVTIVEERAIGPSMGEENIQRGLHSMLWGFGAVVVVMMLYYRFFGLLANLALMVNVMMLTALLSVLGATLTLPGIAGIVLTVGMAVDANVLIFERIREELRLGRSPRSAIVSGFDRALGTIIDANITTLIVGVLLFSVGTGPVRGFAVTLCLGIITSMITAVSVTRVLVELTHRHPKRLRIGL